MRELVEKFEDTFLTFEDRKKSNYEEMADKMIQKQDEILWQFEDEDWDELLQQPHTARYIAGLKGLRQEIEAKKKTESKDENR